MIADFDQIDNGRQLFADVCIIGAGAAGITLATALARTPHTVLLLESGGKSHEPATQHLYDSDVVGLPHRSIHGGRARIMGGTTTLWAGQALPLEPIDFERREWVPNSGWPINGELRPYYRRAERVLGIPSVSYDERTWPRHMARPELEGDETEFRFSQFSNAPNFARAYREELSHARNVTVLMHANVMSIVTNAGASQVERIEIRSLAGKQGTVRARYCIVCCGGIETARLLLASNSIEPNGLGNRHDLVGRYFQEHIHFKAPVHPAHCRAFQSMFRSRKVAGIRSFPKLIASEEFQRANRILNVGADLCYALDEDSAVESAKLLVRSIRQRELRGRVPRALTNMICRPHEIGTAVYGYAVKQQKLSEGRGPMMLSIQSEMVPNPDSRVYLGSATDAMGMRRAVLDWRLSEVEQRTIRCFGEMLAEKFKKHGLGEVDLSKVREHDWTKMTAPPIDDAAHHMGTTRMHADARHGVVDRDCRVHGVANLYIGSSSVFPTGGFSNPTLTIIALCLRMAEQLRGELA